MNRLIDLGILVRDGLKYKINSAPNNDKRDSLAESFEVWVVKEFTKEMNQTKIALEKLQEAYSKK